MARTRNISLKTILFADLAEYSRMVSQREFETLDFIERCFATFRETCERFKGELIKTTGDGVLIAFDSPTEAVSYGLAVHAAFEAMQNNESSKARFRVGIHLGEVERLDHDLYGHAVNVAARLESLAKPGGICISEEVYRQVRRTVPYNFIAGGLTNLKNIPEAIAIYHVVGDGHPAANKPDTDPLILTTIGGFSVTGRSARSAVPHSPHLHGLLGYLALSPNYCALHDRLSALLWPDTPAPEARKALYQCLRAARRSIDPASKQVLYSRENQIGLEPGLVKVDLIEVYRDLSLGTIHDTLVQRSDWPESILSGTDAVSGLYRSWLEVTRHSWRVKVADMLETCLHRFEAPETGARRAAMALLLLEPSHEGALQKLMTHYAAQGNVALAIGLFRDFAAQLEDRFEISPSAETIALAEQLMARQGPRLPGEKRRAEHNRPPRMVIGEFKFDNAEGFETYFVAWLRNALIANLSRFREWVILEASNTSTDSQAAVYPEYLLSAKCAKDHGTLMLSMTLSEPATTRIVWSDTFGVLPESWLKLQRLLVKQIAARLEIYLSTDRVSRVITAHQPNQSSYNNWIYSEHLLSLWKPEADDEAAGLLKRIIENTPSFAPAYASLAGIYNVRHLIRPGSPPDVRLDHRALTLGQRSVELDPLDARNHLTVAWSLAMAGAHAQAGVHYDLAVNLNPCSPRLLISSAQGMAFVGSSERARELLEELEGYGPVSERALNGQP